MSKRVVIIISAVVIAAVVGFLMLPKLLLFMKSRKESVNTGVVEFYVSKRLTLNELATELSSKNIIDDTEAFIEIGEYKGLTPENIALGKYRFEPNTQYRTLLNGFKLNDLGNGNGEVEVEVSFNNCKTINDLAGKIKDQLLLDSTLFVQWISKGSTLEKYGFSIAEIPAMFIPNTYKMFYDTDEKAFLDKMAAAYKVYWTEERRSKLSKIGLKDPVEAVTLASIVYGEQSKNSQEWPVIAGLYLNRLKQGMKLQSDPTFRFCWGDALNGVQRLLNVHKEIECPYNTYKINGLPPGPISMPPMEVVEAVLNPQRHDYIFMMAKPDFSGLHDFSVEYADHERFAKVYQKWLSTLN